MAAAMVTMVSTSAVGVPTLADPPPGFPALPPLDTNLLAGAGVGQGTVIQRMLARTRTPGIHQVCPVASSQQQVTSEPAPATPY